MKSIKEIKHLKGKRVLVRVDFNVPIIKGKVANDFRIKQSIPTIKYLSKKGAKVILVSHAGNDGKQSMKPMLRDLNKYVKASLIPELPDSTMARGKVAEMKNGEIVLFDNIRMNKGEKENSTVFARDLALLADVYVNDAFSVSHREHASIVKVPKFLPSYAGIQLQMEVAELSHTLNPEHPFLVILGGAKAETKIPLVKKYLKEADNVFIGGALANNFFKAKGFQIGRSVVDKKDVILKSFVANPKLILPFSVVVNRGKKKTILVSEMRKNDSIYDVGKSSIDALSSLIKSAKVILWNGPVGWYEHGYTEGTETLVRLLSKAKGKVIIGGGDTSVFVERKGISHKFSFVSTGGGATLGFLTKGTLPGIKALK